MYLKMHFIPVMLNFQQSNLQCHMILQKSFQDADLVLDIFQLLSMLKTDVHDFFFQDCLMNRKFKRTE